MKMRKIVILAILFMSSVLFSQFKLEEKEGAWTVDYVSGVVDSAETFTTAEFNATPFIQLYEQHLTDTGTTAIGTAITELLSHRPYVIVQVKGSGTVDSLSSLYMQGKKPDGTWQVLDTINTAKEVACMTYINYWDAPRFTAINFTGTVADLTVSAYNVRVYITLVIPKAKGATR